MVSQPANNYFALLQASAISHTGPDLAVMWTGLYLPPYADILANIRPYISQSTFNNIEELQWGAQDFDASKAILAMPVDAQFYMGFYNKKDFAKAGIKQVPQDWNQLYAACTALKKVGVTPIVYGSASASYTGEFNPWYRLQLPDDRRTQAVAVGGPVQRHDLVDLADRPGASSLAGTSCSSRAA